ncbi:alpha/beta fold hydrolase [Mycolicibacterium thermoresistibile]
MATRLIPPGSIESFLDLDGGHVRTLRSTVTPSDSSRPPLLLIHGGAADNSAISWYDMFTALGAEHRVIAFDLPGSGATTGIAPLGGPENMADFVMRAAERIGLGPAVVIGVSMGGDVALNVGLRHPSRVRALVLVAPGGLVPRLRSRTLQLSAWLLARLPDALLLPLVRLANRFVDAGVRAVVKKPDALAPEVRAEFAREARRPGAALGYLRYNQATLGPTAMRNNLLPVVHQITVPTLFFHGADDPIVNPDGSRRAAERMPNAELVLVDDCGHWAQLEAGDRFCTELRRFLASIA